MNTSELRRLIERVAPGLGDRVDVTLTGRGFSYQARGGRLRLSGEDPVAAAAGFHHYCTHHLDQRFTWTATTLEMPAELPDAVFSAETELTHRYYLNFVAYGYSSAFWGWERWEKEIDWMALHSINRPLMTIGHEAILFKLYLDGGLAEDEALAWLGSPAHFPWMFMGGLNSWGGPVTREFLDARLRLADRILERMRALGMSPVLPGFGGQVPYPLADDSASMIHWQGWETPYLDPTGETYQDMARRFYRIQEAHFGSDGYYAIDPFIESIPPSEDPGWLRNAGEAIYAALASVFPGAVWVLQAWPFHYHKNYWSQGRAEAFIEAVPRDDILLLDLWAEFAPLWADTEGMFGRPWLWCAVHNYGGRFGLFGDLQGGLESIEEARRSSVRGDLQGIGLAMEAIENNEVYYELLLDQVWEPEPLEEWLARWARTRYGSDTPEAQHVWQILASTLYAPGRSRATPSPVIARPWADRAPFASQRLAGEALETAPGGLSASIDAENDPAVLSTLPDLAVAAGLLLGLPSGPHRDLDLQEILFHVVAQHARYPIREILRRYREEEPGIEVAAEDLATHVRWLDQLAASRPSTLLGTWLAEARGTASSRQEADRFEFDARSLVTVWGTQDSGLHDYSGRHWSGLLTDFYLPRWQIWARWLGDGAKDMDELHTRIINHEEDWRTDTTPYPTRPGVTIDTIAAQVLDWLAHHATHPLTTNRTT